MREKIEEKFDKIKEQVGNNFEDSIYSTESKGSLGCLLNEIAVGNKHDYWMNWEDIVEMLDNFSNLATDQILELMSNKTDTLIQKLNEKIERYSKILHSGKTSKLVEDLDKYMTENIYLECEVKRLKGIITSQKDTIIWKKPHICKHCGMGETLHIYVSEIIGGE